jgi:hypothetical protein
MLLSPLFVKDEISFLLAAVNIHESSEIMAR